ncbi:MAG: hypothetical protein R3F17_07190 [Planctomycetota bacterium]
MQQQLGTPGEVRATGASTPTAPASSSSLYREFVAPDPTSWCSRYTNDFHDNVDEKGGRRPFYSMEDGRLTLNGVPVRRAIAGRSRDLSRFSVAISYLHFHVDQAVAKWKASRKGGFGGRERQRGRATAEGRVGDPRRRAGHLRRAAGRAAARSGTGNPVVGALHPRTARGARGPQRWAAGFRGGDLRCRSLPVFDLTPGLAQVLSEMPGPHPGALPLYFPHDMHWKRRRASRAVERRPGPRSAVGASSRATASSQRGDALRAG